MTKEQMTEEQKIAALRDIAVRQRAVWQNKTHEFVGRFQKDPAWALEWDNNIFRTAAMSEAWACILQAIDNKISFQDIHESRKKFVFGKALSPLRSTSQSANLLSIERLAAMAKVLETLESIEKD